jgi:hypothetical protein
MKLNLFALTLAASAAASVTAMAGSVTSTPTYYKDIAPVLQNRCQECHRKGEVAPMSFMSYDEVRPWAKAIKTAVLTKKMPPWFADPHVGKFSNDRSLSQHEIDTFIAWIDGGAQAGNPKDAPEPRKFAEGWTIGEPDLVFQMPTAIDVPATGVVDYTYVVIPTGFTEDKWVQFAEARPDARSAMHHIIAFLRPPGSHWLKNAKPGVPYIPEGFKGRSQTGGKQEQGSLEDQIPGELLVGYAPGLPPYHLQAWGSQADQGWFRHRSSTALHAQRESHHGPVPGGLDLCQRAGGAPRHEHAGDERFPEDSCR